MQVVSRWSLAKGFALDALFLYAWEARRVGASARRRLDAVGLIVVAVTYVGFLLAYAVLSHVSPSPPVLAALPIIGLLSFACDVCSVALSRWVLRLLSGAERYSLLLAISMLNVGLAVCFVAIPLGLDTPSRPIDPYWVATSMGLVMGSMNLGDVLLASAFFGLAF